MKIKTSVTLSENLLEAIDGLIDESQNRSQFLEIAAWDYIARLRRAQQNERDIEIINRRADYFNAEIMDALEYQVAI
ncbi:MAG: hypothetical protein R3C14_35185 [Caldilineaceae bacterium]